jgi:uncharacterized hydantoinase/oxoprolinase family protein
MVAADAQEFNHRDAIALAGSVADAQASLLAGAIEKVQRHLPQSPTSIILSGHGEFLAQAALAQMQSAAPTISLTQKLGPGISRSASSHALAVLAREVTGT